MKGGEVQCTHRYVVGSCGRQQFWGRGILERSIHDVPVGMRILVGHLSGAKQLQSLPLGQISQSPWVSVV